MPDKRRLKVLIVDDSLLFRETIARGLSQDDSLEIVGTAANAMAANDLINSLKPDVLTLDVEMPIMNGIEFLRQLMPQNPMPVVVVSSVSSNVFDALNAGAVDFVTKPGPGAIAGLENLIRELGVKIKIASMARVSHHKTATSSTRATVGANLAGSSAVDHRNLNDIIAIGASTGGTEALCTIFKQLPREMPPIVVVQHMPPVFTRLFAERLDNCSALKVREAVDGAELKPGEAWIAAGDYHLTVRSRGRSMYIESRTGERVNGHCPSVDVLFDSIAMLQKNGASTIGVQLTGMGVDGAKGLLAIRKAGGFTVCQDEESSVVYGMPKAAWDIGAGVRQLPIAKIAAEIISSR